MTAPDWATAAAALIEPPPRIWKTPGELERHIDPRTVQTPALDLIDAALIELAGTPDGRLIVTMPPQEGKSVRVAGAFPVWWLQQHPDARIVVASYSASLAIRNGRAIRTRITEHPDLGLRLAEDNRSAADWTLRGRDGGVFSIGIGGGLTGRPADLMVIDDPIKDQKEADSPTYRQNVWDWWQTVASARLAPGAAVVVILTRWHQDDLAGRLIADDAGQPWRVLNIPAESDIDDDPLGRQPGEFMTSARGRTREQWELRKRTAGPRAWNALYQGRPSPEAGGVLRAEWWKRYEYPLWIQRPDGVCVLNEPSGSVELIQSWDMTFKDTKGSDFVVGQVWLRRGVDVFLLDQVRGRWSFEESCRQLLALSAKWPQAIAKLIEDKANGPAIMNALRVKVPGMVPVEPEGSKYARAAAISPFVQGGNVWLPDASLAAWADELIEEAKAFPNGAHDDQVDGLTQAVHRLLLVPILDGTQITSDDLLGDDLDYEYEAAGISPY